MAQIIDPMEASAPQKNAGENAGQNTAESAEPPKSTPAPRSPAPPKNRRGHDFSLAKQRADVMNSASSAPDGSPGEQLGADGYWIIRRLIRGEHVTQENSGLAPTEWRNLMDKLGRHAHPA